MFGAARHLSVRLRVTAVCHQSRPGWSEVACLFFALAELAVMEVAPSFSSVLKDCTVIEGQDFVLQCSVQGIPVPQITWLLNGEFLLLQPSGPFGPACILTWLSPIYYSEPSMHK